MRIPLSLAVQVAALLVVLTPLSAAQQVTTGHDPALTLYNGGFAVVRETLDLDLDAGAHPLSVTGVTAALEPDSVILRDPTGKRVLSVLEQGYRNDPVTQARLLQLFEGQTIPFLVERGESVSRVMGRIVRSGYSPGQSGAYRSYAPSNPGSQPVIEVDGELRFSLPGLPLFPSLGDDTILQPTLSWQLYTDTSGPVSAEVAYVTGGFSWDSDYNAVTQEGADTLDLSGWLSMSNHSGKTFRDARIKLMAGDVSKVQETSRSRGGAYAAMGASRGPTVEEKAFDEYHLYSVARPLTLRDGESKQVEMVRADGVPVTRHYVYDGASPQGRPGDGWWMNDTRQAQDYGVQGHGKVWVFREFRNDEASGLGVPLPAGRVRFYTRDEDGQLEFTGESVIDHTPRDERIRLYTGNAFDLVGERTRTDFATERSHWIDETFRISLRNHKDEAVTVSVVEHLYRWSNWQIQESSHPYEKRDSRTIAFPIEVPAHGEVTVEYRVHYSW